jgi:hypothetical protein
MQGRLAEVPVGGAMRAGALVGLVYGLVLGGVLGAAAAWLAGSLAGWEDELTSTYGIGGNLLPFGGSGGILLAVAARWYLVVAGASLAGGLALGIFGALLAGLLAATYNRWRPGATVLLELPPRDDEVGVDAPVAKPTHEPPGPAGRGSGSA